MFYIDGFSVFNIKRSLYGKDALGQSLPERRLRRLFHASTGRQRQAHSLRRVRPTARQALAAGIGNRGEVRRRFSVVAQGFTEQDGETMEWQFRLNWAAIVEEAKQRRKRQKLTQRRLGELAGVSTPTVSRFENSEKDIQLSTVTRILGVLGMLDERVLNFPDENPHYDSLRDIALFNGSDRESAIRCAISREALEDHFDGDSEKPLAVFRANRERIEHEARRKYLAGQLEADGSILIRTTDLS